MQAVTIGDVRLRARHLKLNPGTDVNLFNRLKHGEVTHHLGRERKRKRQFLTSPTQKCISGGSHNAKGGNSLRDKGKWGEPRRGVRRSNSETPQRRERTVSAIEKQCSLSGNGLTTSERRKTGEYKRGGVNRANHQE